MPAATATVTASTSPAAATLAEPAVTGFVTIWGMTINPMGIVLSLAILGILSLLWMGQRDKTKDSFDAWDLVMECPTDGHRKASPTKLAFIAAFVMTSWVVVDSQIKGTLTDAVFAAYLLAWVGPLSARVIFNKSDAPLPKGTL